MSKLNRAPVYFTVAQIQFNPILDLDNYLKIIQPAFRDLGFPDFKHEAVQRVIFTAVEGGNPAPPSIASQSRYSFGNINGTESFVLENNSLGFQTTSYDVFPTFSATLLKGLNILHSAIVLSFVERIGIRYLDAVQPNNNETLSDYLVSEVLGLSEKLNGTAVHSESVTVMNNDAGQMVSRVIITSGKVGFPIEIGATAPKINPRFTATDGLHAILDTDSSYTQRFAFSIEEVTKRLKELKIKITQSFNATVTTHAKKIWDQK
jgi:uncharacterized protein (TIGR04255 family)